MRGNSVSRTTAGKVWVWMAIWMAALNGVAGERHSNLAWVGSIILTGVFISIGFNYLTHPTKGKP